MSSPAVSVIVPNFNHSKFLKERMDSILSQTFTDYEVIILDDCSTDGSLEVIEQFRSNPKVSQIVANDANSGSAFRQWAKGIGLAKGELIWIAESDDSCDPGMLEALVKPFGTSPDLVLSFCRSAVTDACGTVTGIHKNQRRMDEPFIMDGTEFARKMLSRDNAVVNASSAIFRREAALNADGTFLDYRAVGDWIFWTEISRQGLVSYRPEAMNRFRQHSGGTTISMFKTLATELELVSLFNFLRKEGLCPEWKALKPYYQCYYYSFFRCSEKPSEEQVQFLKRSTPLPVRIFARIKHFKRRIVNGDR